MTLLARKATACLSTLVLLHAGVSADRRRRVAGTEHDLGLDGPADTGGRGPLCPPDRVACRVGGHDASRFAGQSHRALLDPQIRDSQRL